MKHLRKYFNRFHEEEEATLSVEAVIMLPLLLWAFLFTYTVFDVYRAKTLALKANYAISDLLSRETNIIDMSYINGTQKLFKYLTQADDSSWMRVTAISCSTDCEKSSRVLDVEWSRATGSTATHSSNDIRTHYNNIVPVIGNGEWLVIVETSVSYKPPFSEKLTGFGERTFTDIVMTRPRFAPQLCFDGVGCGV